MDDAWLIFLLVAKIASVIALFAVTLWFVVTRLSAWYDVQKIKDDYRQKWTAVVVHNEHIEKVEALERETADRRALLPPAPSQVVETGQWISDHEDERLQSLVR